MSTKNTYQLINPYIEGSIQTLVDSKKPFRAAKKIYQNVSHYFTNHVDDFYMVLQNVDTQKLSHFKIRESRDENGDVDYKIQMLDSDLPNDIDKKLLKSVKKITENQTGSGKHKRFNLNDSSDSDSSDSDSSDSLDDILPNQAITKFVYFYLPYYKLNAYALSPLDYNRIFVPMFGLPVNPTLEIRLDLYQY